MITIIVHEISTYQASRLLRTTRSRLANVRIETYQSIFRRLSIPAGTLIFTDFDYLNAIEMEAAASMAQAASSAERAARILNHPLRLLERYPLLRALNDAGLSPIEVTRLDAGDRPSRFPVFLRSEDGWWGPDTDVIENEAAFDLALKTMAERGLPLKRRLAISYEAERDKDGYFRKYGAFRIGTHIMPQHILRNTHWIVKSGNSVSDPQFVSEELDYVRNNPDAAMLMRVFEVGNTEFGRVDYAFKQSRPVIFEINTNPSFPRFRGGVPGREARRGIILDRLIEAFNSIDDMKSHRSRIGFDPPGRGHRWLQSGRWGPLTRLLWRLRLHRRQLSTEPVRQTNE